MTDLKEMSDQELLDEQFNAGYDDQVERAEKIEEELLSRIVIGMEAIEMVKELEKYRMFFESVSCLFAEGVEFMTKAEIYEAIKKETKLLERSKP